MSRTTVLVSCVVALAAATAAAHDFWIGASSLRPRAGEPVTLRLLVGEELEGEPRKRDDRWIERFVVVGPDGKESAPDGKDGDEPAGSFRPASAGTYVVGYRGKRRTITLDAQKFEDYVVSEGLDFVVEERERRKERKIEGLEVYSRCAKAIVVASPAADAPPGTPPPEPAGHDRAMGYPLELFVETHPDRAAAGDELTFRLVYGKKPLAGALVTARASAAPKEALRARTDADGLVRFRLAHAGPWMVKTTHMVRVDLQTVVADWESFWASLAFDVPAKAAPAAKEGDRPPQEPAPGAGPK